MARVIAPVSVLKRMNGDKPQMRNGCLQHRVQRLPGITAVEEDLHLSGYAASGECLLIDFLVPDRP